MNILRWILAIPLAVAIGVGVWFLFFLLITNFNMYGPLLYFAVPVIGGFLSGLAYMSVGCGVAPSHKWQIGWVLTLLMACTLAYFLYFTNFQSIDSMLRPEICISGAALVACLLKMLVKSFRRRKEA
ncbi:MAG: hypothetical protein IKT00_10780 [Prevotella sp.]|nr:hypothetical protein [Prevotella sp.]